MTPFRERNPVPIGLISLIVIIGLVALALEVGNIPFLGGGGTSVTAYFADASGLQTGDNVTVGGVRVGTVKSIDVSGNSVKVGFTVDSGVHLGPGTQAQIKIETLLGKMYVAVQPDESGGTLPGDVIHRPATSTPLQVTDAFQGLGSTAGRINQQLLARSFRVLSSAFKGTPPYVRESLRGLSRLSQTISSRNDQIGQLLSEANSVTGTLAARDAQISKLINDSNLLLQTVEQQADVIHRLLIDTTRVARQLSGLVTDNERILGPALAKLQGTIKILNDNQANLKRSIHLAAPFIRDFLDVLGNGRFFESILQNLPSGLGNACYHIPGVPTTCTGNGQ